MNWNALAKTDSWNVMWKSLEKTAAQTRLSRPDGIWNLLLNTYQKKTKQGLHMNQVSVYLIHQHVIDAYVTPTQSDSVGNGK